MIAWDKLKKEDCKIIVEIVSRYVLHCPDLNYLNCIMDLEACHIFCPIDLIGLLQSKDGDFFHDVCGIFRHIDRETGRLNNFFIPRYARHQ